LWTVFFVGGITGKTLLTAGVAPKFSIFGLARHLLKFRGCFTYSSISRFVFSASAILSSNFVLLLSVDFEWCALCVPPKNMRRGQLVSTQVLFRTKFVSGTTIAPQMILSSPMEEPD